MDGKLVDHSFISEYFSSGAEYEKFILEYSKKKEWEEEFDNILIDGK